MKKLFLIVFIFFISFGVSAQCPVSDLTNLKQKAANIQFVYYPYEDNGSTKFNLIIANTYEYSVYNDSIQINSNMYGENGELRINNLNPGDSYTFYFYATSDNCYGSEVYRKTVSFPKLNPYYKDPVCNGKEDYDLCSKWKEISMSHSEFVEKVSSYTKEEAKESKIIVKEDESLFDLLLQFYLKYYWLVLGATILLGITFIIILRRKDDLIK